MKYIIIYKRKTSASQLNMESMFLDYLTRACNNIYYELYNGDEYFYWHEFLNCDGLINCQNKYDYTIYKEGKMLQSLRIEI